PSSMSWGRLHCIAQVTAISDRNRSTQGQMEINLCEVGVLGLGIRLKDLFQPRMLLGRDRFVEKRFNEQPEFLRVEMVSHGAYPAASLRCKRSSSIFRILATRL